MGNLKNSDEDRDRPVFTSFRTTGAGTLDDPRIRWMGNPDDHGGPEMVRGMELVAREAARIVRRMDIVIRTLQEEEEDRRQGFFHPGGGTAQENRPYFMVYMAPNVGDELDAEGRLFYEAGSNGVPLRLAVPNEHSPNPELYDWDQANYLREAEDHWFSRKGRK